MKYLHNKVYKLSLMNGFLQELMDKLRPPHRFEDLFWFEWPGTMAVIVIGLALSFFLFGFWWPYWTISDMDLWAVYNAFLLNDHLPQEFFDHPGYLSFVLLANWLHALHVFGVVAVDRLSLLPTPADAGPAWTDAIRAGRILSLILALVFVICFGFLLRQLVRDWRVAALATLFLAFSGGVALEARIMRTELIAAGLVFLALLILLIAARSPSTWWRPFAVGLAALLATLGFENKVQALLLICALPPILLMFRTPRSDGNDFWRNARLAFPLMVGSAAVAILFTLAAFPLIRFGYIGAASSIFHWRPFVWRFGAYQPLILLWIALSMLVFSKINRVAVMEAATALIAACGGAALGVMALYISYQPQNVLTTINPLEQMAYMVRNRAVFSGGDTVLNFLAALFNGCGGVVLKRTFFLSSSARPTIFLEWFVIAATIYAYRTGRRMLAVQTAVIMAVVWGIDTVNTIRGLKMEYLIYTDPLTIIAASLLMADQVELRRHRWAYSIGLVLIAIHIVIGQSEPVKHTISHNPKPEFCVKHFEYTPRIESYSFCKQL